MKVNTRYYSYYGLEEGDRIKIIGQTDGIFRSVTKSFDDIKVIKEYPYFIQVTGYRFHDNQINDIPFCINKADLFTGQTVIAYKNGKIINKVNKVA